MKLRDQFIDGRSGRRLQGRILRGREARGLPVLGLAATHQGRTILNENSKRSSERAETMPQQYAVGRADGVTGG